MFLFVYVVKKRSTILLLFLFIDTLEHKNSIWIHEKAVFSGHFRYIWFIKCIRFFAHFVAFYIFYISTDENNKNLATLVTMQKKNVLRTKSTKKNNQAETTRGKKT